MSFSRTPATPRSTTSRRRPPFPTVTGDDPYARRLRRLGRDQQARAAAGCTPSWDDLELLHTPRGTRTTFLLDRAIGYQASGITMAMFELGPGRGPVDAPAPRRGLALRGRGHRATPTWARSPRAARTTRGRRATSSSSTTSCGTSTSTTTRRTPRRSSGSTCSTACSRRCGCSATRWCSSRSRRTHIRDEQAGDPTTIEWPELERPDLAVTPAGRSRPGSSACTCSPPTTTTGPGTRIDHAARAQGTAARHRPAHAAARPALAELSGAAARPDRARRARPAPARRRWPGVSRRRRRWRVATRGRDDARRGRPARLPQRHARREPARVAAACSRTRCPSSPPGVRTRSCWSTRSRASPCAGRQRRSRPTRSTCTARPTRCSAGIDAVAQDLPQVLFLATTNFADAVDEAFLVRADLVLRLAARRADDRPDHPAQPARARRLWSGTAPLAHDDEVARQAAADACAVDRRRRARKLGSSALTLRQEVCRDPEQVDRRRPGRRGPIPHAGVRR